MKPLKIVLISKNSYPMLGPRAHRTTELGKELAKRGHEVIIYALLGDFDYSEISRETGITFKNLGISKLGVTDNVGYYNRALWAKGLRKLFSKSLEIPSVELVSMVMRVIKNEDKIDYLISIAHPHTIHWGVASSIEKYKGKIGFWVADCGDPYMMDPFNHHPKYFAFLEKKWGGLCNYISVPIDSAKEAYYPEFLSKIKVIPQGFQFDNLKLAEYKRNLIPTFAFSGKVYSGLRDPDKLLEYLCTVTYDFKFIVYTKNTYLFESYKSILGDKLEIRHYVPRSDLLYELSKMDFLINIKNISSVQQPSKLIDYAITKRPILEISSSFDNNFEFEQFISGNYNTQYRVENIETYNIVKVADKFIELYKVKL